MSDHDDLITRSFAGAIGLPAWNVRRGYADNLTLEFGDPSLEVRQPITSNSESIRIREMLARRRVSVRGAWHLWVHACNWRVLDNGREIASSESSDPEIDTAATFLDGQVLTRLDVDPRTATTSFVFDLGGELETTPYEFNDPAPVDQWLLYAPGGRVLAYRSDGSVQIEPGNLLNRHLSVPTLRTERLTLRPPVEADFPAYAALMASPRSVGMGGPFDERAAWGLFCHDIACWALFGHGALMIDVAASGDCVGQVGINHGPLFPEKELGWMLYDGHEGQGYATEAAAAMRDWAFGTLGLDTLVSYCDPANHSSIAVAERLGAVRDETAARQDPEDVVFRHVPPATRER